MAPGGVQRGIIATLSQADRAQFRYAVLCTKKEGDWASRLSAINVPVHTCKTLPPWDPYQILRLARVIRKLRPALVHIHMAPTVLGAATAARLAGVPAMVIHHHNDYTRHWNELNPLLRNWEFALTRHAGAVLGVSRAVAETTRLRLGLDPAKVHVVYNGIDTDYFANATPQDPRAEWGLAPETPLVIYTARYLDTKRIEDFIQAAARVRGRWQGAGPLPVFAVLGGGAASYAQRYRAEVERCGVQQGCLLPGTRQDVPGILRTAQTGVLCSEMEGFAQVVHEYAAAGLPVVAADQPCITEKFTDGQHALIYPTGDVEALSVAIERTLSDAGLRARLIEQGRAILPQFSWKKAELAYEAIYRQLLFPFASAEHRDNCPQDATRNAEEPR